MSEKLNLSDNASEVEIAYTEIMLIEKFRQYGLKPQEVHAKLKVDLSNLVLIDTSEEMQDDAHFFKLLEALKSWPSGHSAESFVTSLNHLVFLWLNAVQADVSLQSILRLLKCFELPSRIGFSKSEKFHLFLYDIVIETLHQYQQQTLDYTFNYDADVELPKSNQITPNIDAAIEQTNKRQFIGLFSLQFQAEKNNLFFSKSITIDLNKQIVGILRENIGGSAQLYISGDSQFDILIPKLTNISQLTLLAAKITRAFEEMLFLNKQSILITPYIGCSSTTTDVKTAQELYHHTRLALDHAMSKQQFFVMYSDELKQLISEQEDLEAKVLEAFDSNNLTLFFQPIVELENTKCVGAELLLRWSEKYGQNVSPSLTIEILNKVGKGKLFTRWLINSACRYASELKQKQKLELYLTLNLRAEDLYDTELPPMLSQATTLWKLDPKNIILEVTENGILEYNDDTNSVINALSHEGFRFALDDFGTGHSSLTRLRTMPIDLIKIDQSFVKNINNSKDDFEIVQSISMLAKSLGKEVLAEGVETLECLNLIKRLKIDKCQGFYFAKPMPFEQFIQWIRTH